MNGEKRCPRCATVKPREMFSRHVNRADGLQAVCKDCELVYRRRTQRQSDLMRNYRLTPEQFDEMLAAQGGGCAICGDTEARFVVDHDHKCCPSPDKKNARACGRCTRGILCHPCNIRIGMRREDPAQLTPIEASYVIGRAS